MERVNYFSGQLLGVDDLRAEQNYLREKQRRHNRHLHGWGVVSGLEVRAPSAGEPPIEITITPGYALTPTGDEICVTAETRLDLHAIIAEHQCEPAAVYIAIRYAEVLTHPVQVEIDLGDRAYSRVREGFEIHALRHMPEHGYDWVPLASIRLHGDPTTPVKSRDISYEPRRLLALNPNPTL